MGWPVGHSRSPRLHGYWLEQYGIDGAYVPLPVKPDSLGRALAALPALGFAGVNLTLPHKEAALKFLARIDRMAERIGAVNTVTVEPDGALVGSNTDAFGFIENLKAGAPQWRAGDGPAVVLGAGGAARAVGVALLEAGAPEIRIANRTHERAQALAAALDPRCQAVGWSDRGKSLKSINLLVNTTSLGMAGQPPLNLDLSQLPPSAIVNDIVYVPLETALLAAARKRGNPVVDGLGMLLHQGRPGFKAWFGVDPDVTAGLRRALVEDLAR
jgi:shikimate dehydrogenase